VLADELFQHRRRTAFDGEDDRVFGHPQKGTPLDPARYAETFRAVLAKAGITDRVRSFHDGRHTSITNAAAAGTAPEALSTRAGHSDYSTTRLYIHLAGEAFREEADRLEERVFAHLAPKTAPTVPES
jgi:integrase